jgi:hypothetical protein
MLRTDVVTAVVDLAADAAKRARPTGDPVVAFRAARSGLRASPYENGSTDSPCKPPMRKVPPANCTPS